METKARTISQEVEAAEAGFDPLRMARITDHFKRYVDDGRLPGWLIAISRQAKVAYLETYGDRDMEAGLPVEPDTIFRIYSMTKPVTSVAAMMLWEEGAFELSTPVSKFIPEFEDVRVYVRGSSNKPLTVPASETMTVWHLLTHTSGLSYGFHHAHAVDEMYRARGFEWSWPQGATLESACSTWASLPLLFQPGAEWNYSNSTDVLGRIVELVGGRPLDEFFAERIFEPLGMVDTGFWAAPDKQDRLAALYAVAPNVPSPFRWDDMGKVVLDKPSLFSGGGGLVSTAADYHRFCRMLLGKGELDGSRLLAPRTVEYMTRNHLPGDADLAGFGRPLFAETSYAGVGFGLGFQVIVDPVRYGLPANPGEFAWGGAASTTFAVDPKDELILIFMTQLLPSSTYPIRSELRQLIYQARVS